MPEKVTPRPEKHGHPTCNGPWQGLESPEHSSQTKAAAGHCRSSQAMEAPGALLSGAAAPARCAAVCVPASWARDGRRRNHTGFSSAPRASFLGKGGTGREKQGLRAPGFAGQTCGT